MNTASLEQEARALVERLGGRWSKGGGLCRCPAHDDRTPSLSVRVGHCRVLLHCFAGCEASAILRALNAAGLLTQPGPATSEVSAAPCHGDMRDAAARLWNESRALGGTSAESYLASRGLISNSPELRFHPRTPCGRWPLTTYRSALVAAVRDESGLIAVHRTFLDGPEPERKGLGRYGAGAVRLGGTGSRLGLAEGIETALAATSLFGGPCWATLGSEGFARIELPATVTELLLFIDNDSGGRRAEALARRAFAAVVRIKVHCPPRAGDDWNDVLRRRL